MWLSLTERQIRKQQNLRFFKPQVLPTIRQQRSFQSEKMPAYRTAKLSAIYEDAETRTETRI